MKWFLCGFDFSPNCVFFVFGGVSLVHERGIFALDLTLSVANTLIIV